ncbi:hypothetical protein ACQPZF_19880 [Actinosynnema sp. CS-041913]|uniref:hypothetical protein n=1 Tax=Actinosynnema sp. CS-041913 TaxID=3239917 RepID=UPI003D925535
MVLAVGPVVLTLWSVSLPGGFFEMALIALVCWVVVGLLWLVVAVLAVVALPPPRARQSARLWPFLVVPALLVATWATARTGVVERLVFDVHRSALERLVADVTADPDRRVGHQEVGLYSITSAAGAPSGGCTLITLEHGGFLTSTGFAHCPEHVPSGAGSADGYVYTHIDGPWYEFAFTW